MLSMGKDAGNINIIEARACRRSLPDTHKTDA